MQTNNVQSPRFRPLPPPCVLDGPGELEQVGKTPAWVD